MEVEVTPQDNSVKPAQQKDVIITYETLYELFRREKNRPELQELPETFFNDVLEYLLEKQQILEESQRKVDIFSEGEREKTQLQLVNIKKLIKDLYERREKKIMEMAVNKSRTGSDIINTGNLLEVERNMFDILVDFLNKFRQGIVNNIIAAKEPKISIDAAKEDSAELGKEPEAAEKEEQKETKMIRFLHPVPQFVDKDLQVLGPFEEEDMSSLPAEIADVLIKKGRAEEMREQ